MKNSVSIVFIFFLLFSNSSVAQSGLNEFLEPSDTLNIKRRNLVITSEAVLTSAALIGLNQLWYADYEKSSFHFKNDNNDWLQMDKAGHIYSSYHLGRMSAEMFDWSGVSKKNQLIYGAGYGFVFLTAVEVFDGYSAEWGFSWGDVAANTTGTALYVSQELLWDEQRIIPKFSFHSTKYANQRPELLGETFSEQILKDYNGQTYWLSVNLHSFAKTSKIPKWLNLAVGYGAEGMLSSQKNDFTINDDRFRQFYLSFDVDLSKIETNSHFLKTIFSLFNTIKIPAPTFEINSLGKSKFHVFYF